MLELIEKECAARHEGWVEQAETKITTAVEGVQQMGDVSKEMLVENAKALLKSLSAPISINGAFFRNESGTFSPTPYGDSVDVVLSDVHETVLAMYDTVVVAGLLFELTC